jgi:hypothetical protein
VRGDGGDKLAEQHLVAGGALPGQLVRQVVATQTSVTMRAATPAENGWTADRVNRSR